MPLGETRISICTAHVTGMPTNENSAFSPPALPRRGQTHYQRDTYVISATSAGFFSSPLPTPPRPALSASENSELTFIYDPRPAADLRYPIRPTLRVTFVSRRDRKYIINDGLSNFIHTWYVRDNRSMIHCIDRNAVASSRRFPLPNISAEEAI